MLAVNNTWKKTGFYLIIVFLSFTVIIPMMYLTTTSFSSSIEIADYPKQLIPSLSHDLKIEWDEEESYYILYRQANDGEYDGLYFGTSYEKFQDYLTTYLNVSKTEEELEDDFSVARDTGEPVYLKYNKDLFNNFKKFIFVSA